MTDSLRRVTPQRFLLAIAIGLFALAAAGVDFGSDINFVAAGLALFAASFWS